MSGTGSALAVPVVRTPERQAPAALAIKAGQTVWDEYQTAALNQLGLRNAGNGDRAVFLHVSQRTGLDPFARQIYMIERKEKSGGDWVSKWTIQTGIEGWRVIRDRAERREGVRGKLKRFAYYDHDDNRHKAWTRAEPPAAVEATYTVRDRNGVKTPYTSVLRFTEYVQTKEINGQRVPIAQWAVKPVHMLEKCTEADVYRKAFPQDYSGVHLDDSMPAPDPDAPPIQVQQDRPRVTAAAARERRPQTVTAVATVVTPDASPAQSDPPPAAAATPPQQGAGEAPAPIGPDSPNSVTAPQLKAIWTILKNVFGYAQAEQDKARDVCASIVDHELATTTMLSQNEAENILDRLGEIRREAAESAAKPRDYLELMTAPQAAQDAEPAGE